MNHYSELLEKIDNRDSLIGILGLGYVGLPLAILFAKNKFKVIGIDPSSKKIESIKNGINYISDINNSEFSDALSSGNFRAYADFSELSNCDIVIICVPTPLDKFKKPDMSFIENAGKEIGKNMKSGVLVSLESTTYPTTTEDFLLPLIEDISGKKHGEDFWICFSPERVDPGNKEYKTENTPKIVGGLGEPATNIAMALYSKVIKQLHRVSSPRIAEMVKILENTYRLVNISLINEIALLCGKMDIDIWEVIEAAKTKPYGFQAFYPGPGIGGHCIPLDPFYLEYIAKNFNFSLTMINTAGNIDNLMTHRMVIKINTALNKTKKSINGSKIMVLGVAYKPDIDDERESPALKIIEELIAKGADVSFHDPFIAKVNLGHGRFLSSEVLSEESIAQKDCLVITTNHSVFDYSFINKNAKLIVDLRNAIKFKSEKVYKL